MYNGEEYSGSPKLKFNCEYMDEETDFSKISVKLHSPSQEDAVLNTKYDSEDNLLILYNLFIKEIRCSCEGVQDTGKKASYSIDEYPQHYDMNCPIISRFEL